jgi:hypothetical protein
VLSYPGHISVPLISSVEGPKLGSGIGVAGVVVETSVGSVVTCGEGATVVGSVVVGSTVVGSAVVV